MKDLPLLLSLNSHPKADSEDVSDAESEASASGSSRTSSLKQYFSLARDPTMFDPGTIPISPSIFNVSANRPDAIAAVVIGAGFTEDWERIMEYCSNVREKVTWFRTESAKSKMLGPERMEKSEDLGRMVKEALEWWVKEGNKRDGLGMGTGAVRYC